MEQVNWCTEEWGRGRGWYHCVGVPACGLITSFIMHFFPAFPVFTAHATRHINVAINLALPRHVARQQVDKAGKGREGGAYCMQHT